MKKNVIAMMLSLVLAVGSVGGAPVLAAETTAAETTSAEAVEIAGTEEAAAPEVSDENEDTDTGATHEDASGEETAPEETAQEEEEEPAQEDREPAQETDDTIEEASPAEEEEEAAPSTEEEEAAEEAPEASDDTEQEESADLGETVPADEVITDADPESVPEGELVEEIVTEDSNEAQGYTLGVDIVEYARTYQGRVPYVHGAGNNKDISDLTGGTDCNGFVCGVFFHFDINLWPYRIKIRNSPLLTNIGTDLSKAQPGDILYWEETIPGAGNGHVAIYDGGGWMVHETTDSYNGMSSNVLYTPVSLVSSGWPISGIYRAADVLAEPPLPKVHGTSPIDIGGSFYAYIRNQASNLYLTNQKDNIAGEEFTGENTQVWRFQRQSNEAYVITSIDDNACMDVISFSHDNGANVYAYNRGFVGGDNQQFYIYWSYDAYYISPAHTNGSHALNMSSTTHNLEIWDVKGDWDPQEYDIYIIPMAHNTMPYNLGEDFYAYIRNQAANVYLTNQKDNIAGEEFTGESTQVWRFQRLNNGAYVISSADNNACMDVLSASQSNGANIYAYSGGYVGGDNQQFFIYRAYDAFYISPAHTRGIRMADMSLDSYNLEMWYIGSDWAPQEFDIETVTYTVKYNANGGSKAPSSQTKAYNQNLTLRTSVPVRDGYDFLGWASNKNATASEYDPGASYTANKDITLYAVWKRSTKLRGISLPESGTVKYGQTLTYQVTYDPEDTTDDKTVTWSSGNTKIFKVSSKGVVTPVGIGTAVLTAKVGSFTATSEVTVTKGTPKYTKPGPFDASCGQKLSEIALPSGFAWSKPGQDVGSVGTKTFAATFTPEDTAHYNNVSNIKVSVNVSHSYASEWTAGTDTHWHECKCGAKADEAEHTYGDWTIDKQPTITEEGSKSIHCTVCDAVKAGSAVSIPTLRDQLGKTTRGDMFNLANNVKVTWKEVPGAKYYKVYREGVTDKKETQKEPVIVTQRLIGWDQQPGLTNGHAYRYTIVASLTGKGDSSGDSKRSYSKLMYRLKTVVIRSAKNTEPGKITVKYDKTTSGDSYVLQYCDREDMVGAKTKVVLGAENTSYTIGGLKKGKTYYISIRVRKKVKGIDYYTTFGVPRKVTVTK